jgi:hypothetical protein
MADGKDRQKALQAFDDELNAPFDAGHVDDALMRDLARPA